MKRREFITLLGGAAAVWPLAARAQQSKLPTIGLLGGATASARPNGLTAFVQRLHELGWVEGHTVAIEYRWAEGRSERSPAIIAEFVRLKVDVIVTHATPHVLAAKQATSVVPIVFPSAGDPVGNGLVTSLARPGGNVTGLSVQSSDLWFTEKSEAVRQPRGPGGRAGPNSGRISVVVMSSKAWRACCALAIIAAVACGRSVDRAVAVDAARRLTRDECAPDHR